MKFLVTTLCIGLGVVLAAPAASGQTVAIDDSPFVRVAGFGFGAENPFGWFAPGFPPGLAPSPHIGVLMPPLMTPCMDGDVLAPGPTLQLLSPDGFFVDSITDNNKEIPATIVPTVLRLQFSVDRLTMGVPPTDVQVQFMLQQQPADVFVTNAFYRHPSGFAGWAGGAPYGGPLPALAGGAFWNHLFFDDSLFGFWSGGPGMVIPPNVMAPFIGPGTHDNLDEFDLEMMDTNNDQMFDNWSYFTVYPDQAVVAGVSAADIFDVAPGTPGTVPPPFAPAISMGLDQLQGPDSIDALVVWDNDERGGPANGGPGAQPGIDYALFSLSPSSGSLLAIPGLTASDIFFTDFTGKFFLYANVVELGLIPGPPFEIGSDNVDGLEIVCAYDLDADRKIGFNDLLQVLSNWGVLAPPPRLEDIDGNGIVGYGDLLLVLSNWGPCP